MASHSRISSVLALSAVLAGCGGTGSSSSTTLSIGTGTSLAKGRTLSVAATFARDGASNDCTAVAQWSSSDSAVATVAAGAVTAVNVGRTTMAASCSGHTGAAVLVVTPPEIVSLEIKPDSSALPAGPGELPAGLREQLVARETLTDGYVSGSDPSFVVWSSSNPSAFTVSNELGSEGVITAQGSAGQTATITAVHPASGLRASVVRTVADASVTLASVSLSPQDATVPLGTEGRFVLAGTFSDGQKANVSPSFVFTSSDPSVAKFDPASPIGYVTTVGMGSAMISADPILPAATGHAATASLTVTSPVISRIELTPTSTKTPVGLTLQLSGIATLTDRTRQPVTPSAWTSSVPGVATVSDGGLVSAVAPGYSTIAASYATAYGRFATTTQIEVVQP